MIFLQLGLTEGVSSAIINLYNQYCTVVYNTKIPDYGGEAVRRNNRIRLLCGLLALLMLTSGCVQKEPESTQPTGQLNMSFGGLVCLEYSRYTGAFPEDGKDTQVSNVAAMLIHNSSTQFLEYATIECAIGEQTGFFFVTGLPPGAMVWVLERSGMTLSEGDTFKATKCEDYVYRDDAIMMTDKLSVCSEGNTLTVTNNTDGTLDNVTVYYKTVMEDGRYFGGISYLLSFGSLPPGGSASKASSHFGPDAKIVRYSFQESG